MSVYFVMRNGPMRRLVQGKDIHKFLGFAKPIFADSGGFTNGRSETHYSPIEVLNFQESINCDALATLDYPLFDVNRREKERRILNTIRNIGLAIEKRTDKQTLLYACIHGETADEAVRFIDRLEDHSYLDDIDALAIGSVVPRKDQFIEILEIVKAVRTRTGKPIHVFGISGFKIIPFLLMAGADSFDSKTFAHASRFRYWIDPTTLTRIHIEKLRRRDCHCKACRTYELKDCLAPGSLGASRIAAHNFQIYTELVSRLGRSLSDPNRFLTAIRPCLDKITNFDSRVLPVLQEKELIPQEFVDEYDSERREPNN